jgi:Na+-translocating ferredoxin:NAD+ oxidoreductase RnfG subunit
LFDKTKSVTSVVVYNYEATHGQEITAKGWLKQFLGYNGSRNLVVGKNIDSISGATISVNAITADIARNTALLKSKN